MIKPSTTLRALSHLVRPNTHVYVDIGNCMAWAIHHFRRDVPGRWHINLIFGCMGHALPAAIGGCLASAQHVVAIAGDAAFAMSAFELHTAVEEQLPLIVLVLNDSGHGMVEMGSAHQYGPGAVPNARFKHRIAAADLARCLGAQASLVDSPEALAHAFARASAEPGPSLIDILIDPTELPPFGSRMKLLKENFGPST